MDPCRSQDPWASLTYLLEHPFIHGEGIIPTDLFRSPRRMNPHPFHPRRRNLLTLRTLRQMISLYICI
ncbi:Hypothetical protein FKW44_017165 [Caligus rogercresseyi]|uniref:Uncharacterized protein n=1 Tax=Caligus rogercresseyi TaxID=217165 RepID=A0A7T8H3F2_CALRO|nr:Hypothetical protein FKW44_017165 [Caligus rogercresseyi]